MSAGLTQLGEQLRAYLQSNGIDALAAWPGTPRTHTTRPVAVVSLQGCKVEAAGFCDYLGERLNGKNGRWEELYGRKAQIIFALDLYASGREEGDGLQEAFDQLAGVLTTGGPPELVVQEFSCGQTQYDQKTRLLKRPVELACQAYLCAAAQEGEAFTEFELRGGIAR